MIQIKTPHELALMREAGLVTAGAPWRGARRPSGPGVSTAELDAIAEDDDPRRRARCPSFIGYHGFPAPSAPR